MRSCKKSAHEKAVRPLSIFVYNSSALNKAGQTPPYMPTLQLECTRKPVGHQLVSFDKHIQNGDQPSTSTAALVARRMKGRPSPISTRTRRALGLGGDRCLRSTRRRRLRATHRIPFWRRRSNLAGRSTRPVASPVLLWAMIIRHPPHPRDRWLGLLWVHDYPTNPHQTGCKRCFGCGP